MPLPTWIQLFVGVSVLFSGMALWHRYRLWRVDADRVTIEREIPALFGPGVTVDDIATMAPAPGHRTPEAAAAIDGIIGRLDAAVGPVPQAFAVDARADGRGNVVPLPGDADLRPAARAPPVPGAVADVGCSEHLHRRIRRRRRRSAGSVRCPSLPQPRGGPGGQ